MPISAANLKTLRVNLDWAALPLFDRTGWTKVRFGDVVRVLKEQVDPASGEVERYVAGEHMDSENVHIRRWGTIGDGYLGPAFIRRFRKGQVLYGSRRTYLKKVAVAEWDGVTANTTFVLEALEGRLRQELLPWLMLSARFTKHSVLESKGSTNPYINWPDIAKFEFQLPPPDQQRRLADVLLKLDEVVESRLALSTAIEGLLEGTAASLFGGIAHRKTPLNTLIRDGDVGLQTGPFGTILAASSYTSSGVPVIHPVNMDGDSFDTSNGPFISREEADRLSRYQVRPGDIVMCRKRHVGRMVEIRDQHDGFIIGSDCIRIRTRQDRLLSSYLLLYLRSAAIQHWLVRATIGTVMPGMNEAILGKLDIPVPERRTQDDIIVSLRRILDVRTAVESDVSELRQFARTLRDTVFAANNSASTAKQS